MTEASALIRTICTTPEADLPRLVFADYLEETGDPERAAFIRAQVNAARQPNWEPFPTWCRHIKPQWHNGRPWVNCLHPLPPGQGVVWDQPSPFYRGFGWKVLIRSLHAWHEVAPRLFDAEPVGELHLQPAATLDDWRQFARAEWIHRLRVLRLDGANLSEPLFALRECEAPPPLEDVHFLRASSPGIGFILADLLGSRLARTIRGLHLRAGMNRHDDLLDVLTHHGGKLERLTLRSMHIDPEFLEGLQTHKGLPRLSSLNLSGNPLSAAGLRSLALWLDQRHANPQAMPLHSLELHDIHLDSEGMEHLSHCSALASLRRLDLSGMPLPSRAVQLLAESKPLSGLRALNLAECRITDADVHKLTHAKFWPHLVELDLRDNPLTSAGARYLCEAAVPIDLTALLIEDTNLDTSSHELLRRVFSDAVRFVPTKWGRD